MARGREPAVQVYDVYTYKSHLRIAARGDTGRWYHEGDNIEPGKWNLNTGNFCAYVWLPTQKANTSVLWRHVQSSPQFIGCFIKVNKPRAAAVRSHLYRSAATSHLSYHHHQARLLSECRTAKILLFIWHFPECSWW